MTRIKVSRINADVKYSLIQFSRNWQSIFFTFILPFLFMILGWFLFGIPAGAAYVSYLIPGILGIAVMAPAMDLTVGMITGYRAIGSLKKISTTPLSSLEWNLARALTGSVVASFSVMASLLAAWLMFGYVPAINAVSIWLVIAGAFMSVGMGMLIAHLVKDREAASMAAFTVVFPQILISGSIFPTEQLPGFLGVIVDVSPLTYLNDGLRSAMVTGNTVNAMTDLAIVSVLAIVLFGLGVAMIIRGE